MKEPLVSTVTVNYNHKYFPKLSVEALEKSNLKDQTEIIFVDNASTDRESLHFLEEADKEGRIKLIKSPENVGFAAGNNLGFKHSHGKFILILNPDTQVQPNSLLKMVAYLQSHPDVGILGPKLEYSDGTIQTSCRRDMALIDLIIKRTFLKKLPYFKTRLSRYLMQDFDHNRTQEVELITGACMMIPRDFYEQIGGFDERYFLFMEDFDLCKKTRATGKKVVYYPEAVVNHYHKRLSEGSVFGLLGKKVFWLHFLSAIKYFWKWR